MFYNNIIFYLQQLKKNKLTTDVYAQMYIQNLDINKSDLTQLYLHLLHLKIIKKGSCYIFMEATKNLRHSENHACYFFFYMLSHISLFPFQVIYISILWLWQMLFL